MFFLVFFLILLTNYVIVADMSENSKTMYYIVLAAVGILFIVTKVLGG